MTDAASRATSPTTPEEPRPLLLTVAAVLTWVTALMALLLPLTSFVNRSFTACQVTLGNLKTVPTGTAYLDDLRGCLAGTGQYRPATGSDVTKALQAGVVQSVISLLVLVALGYFVWKGRPLARWFLVGVWILSNLIALTPFGVLSIQAVGLHVFSGLYLTVLVLGVVAFTAAAVVVNLPPVTRYLNERRPVRTAAGRPAAGQGGMFGGLFGPRPAPRSPGTQTSSSSRTDSRGSGGSSTPGGTGGATPASTRPAKSKNRAGGPAGTRPGGGARGKSRRG